MSNIYFTADPHLGHKNIHKLRSFVDSPEQNTQLFLREAARKLSKRSVTYFLGDVAFDLDSLKLIDKLKGRKILIKGNHDDKVPTRDQLKVFEEIQSLVKYKRFWLSHAPIHHDELRGKRNIHGHVHNATILDGIKEDQRYINICPEARWQYFTSLDEIREGIKMPTKPPK